jgi:hypothetical protein
MVNTARRLPPEIKFLTLKAEQSAVRLPATPYEAVASDLVGEIDGEFR